MKFLIAFVALVAVAAAGNKPIDSQLATIEAIIAAINSPSTDPATAVLLEQQLQEIIGALVPEPIAVGPAIVDSQPISVGPAIVDPSQPISIGPAIVDFPVGADGTVISETPDVAPAVVPPVQPSSAPLVQIILNINQASSEGPTAPVVAVPIPAPESVIDAAPEPVSVVEVAEPQPVVVGQPVLPVMPVVPVAPVAPVAPVGIMPLPAIIN